MGVATKPEWLKIRPSYNNDFSKIKHILRKRNLVSVCEEANCPNMSECWHNEGTATFMVLGDTCTRGCKFCAIKTSAKGQKVDFFEPIKIAQAVEEIGLDYVVITSVDRDDLEDFGAKHFARCIIEIKKKRNQAKVEVLVGDFAGNFSNLQKIIEAGPDVIAHNIETIERLQKKVRDPRANYNLSLEVLRYVKRKNPKIYTKSSIMLGLGENKREVIETMKDLRNSGCDIFTLGQYLKPKNRFLKVEEWVSPQKFEEYKKEGIKLGFLYVASGPFVRSSYKASELFIKSLIENNK